MMLSKGITIVLAVGALGSVEVAAAPIAQLAPRRELPAPAQLTRPAGPSRLIVKFRDGLRARSVAGAIVSAAGRDVAAVQAVAAAHAATFAPLIRLPDATLGP